MVYRDSFLVISSTVDGYEGCFERWIVKTDGEAELKSSKVQTLVPGKFSLNQITAFKCQSKADLPVARCLFVMKDIESYIVEYELEESQQSLGSMVSNKIVSSISNMANYEAVDLDFMNEHAVVSLESLLDSKRVAAVYSLESSSDVFRVLEGSDFGSESLFVGLPKFFVDSHDELKLSFLNPIKGGIKTFRLDGAKLIATSLNNINKDIKIKAVGVSEETSEVRIDSLFELPDQLPNNPEKYGIAKILISCVLIGLLLAIPCYFGFKMFTAKKNTDADLLDKLNSSSKIDYDDTLKFDTASQIKNESLVKSRIGDDQVLVEDKMSKNSEP